jgi:hypothetical protein
MATRWTRARLLAGMLKAFRQPTVVVKCKALNPKERSAESEYSWEDGKLHMTLWIDKAQDGDIQNVTHEVIHPLIDAVLWDGPEAIFSKQVGEWAIYGVGFRLHEWLVKHPKEYERWRNAIARKVETA